MLSKVEVYSSKETFTRVKEKGYLSKAIVTRVRDQTETGEENMKNAYSSKQMVTRVKLSGLFKNSRYIFEVQVSILSPLLE